VPDSRSTLEILVDVRNGQQGAKEIRDVGTAAKDTGTAAEGAGSGFKSMAGKLAVAAGGAIAVRKGYSFLKDAADQTAQLAKSTALMTRQTGMDTQSASAWVSMAKSRGIETETLTKSFTIFSKQLRAVESGSKAATKAFADIGVSADQLKGKSLEESLLTTADAFEKLPAGADKAAIAQQLFGRQSQALLPLLNLGREGIQEQMATMQKYGLTLDEQGVKKGLELAKTQREMKAATDGLKISIGTALMPILVSAASAILPVVQAISQFVGNSKLLQTILPPIAIAIAAVTAAQIALNIAMAANPVGLVVIALVGLGAALVAVYKNVSWFRDGVNAAFNGIKTVVGAVVNFIKSNWKTIGVVILALTGPIGLVVAAFIKFKDQIMGVIDAVIGKIKGLVDAAKSVADSVGGVLGKVGGAIGSAAGAVGGAVGLQHGGTIGSGGRLALVGEAGPELLQLPGGSRVTPLQAGTTPGVDMRGAFGEIHVHLDVEGRELAHVIAKETATSQARR
jgi:hypothetical protein